MLYILVPYRNRDEHLRIFLEKVPEYLNKDNIKFKIVIGEQKDNNPFNRGKLLNCLFSYIESGLLDDDIICFHDVDTIPNDDILKFDYKTYIKDSVRHQYGQYEWLTNMFMCNKHTFKIVNGYPNNYVGWGREDDCINHRFKHLNIQYDKRNFINRVIELELPHKYDTNVNDYWNRNNVLFEKEKNNPQTYLLNGLSNLKFDIENIKIINDTIEKIDFLI